MAKAQRYVFDGEQLDNAYTYVEFESGLQRELRRYDELTSEEYERLTVTSKRDIDRWKKEGMVSIHTGATPAKPPAAEA